MTDLLVWSLMADGGLETALNEALGLDISELTDSEENFEQSGTHITIPLLYLIRQLIRCVFFSCGWYFCFILTFDQRPLA